MTQEQLNDIVAAIQKITEGMSAEEVTQVLRRVCQDRREQDFPALQKKLQEVKARRDASRQHFWETHARTKELIAEHKKRQGRE